MGNIEAPCPHQRPQRRELGNIALATCVLPMEFWHWTNCENRCVSLLWNRSTQHWIPFQAPPAFGKFVSSIRKAFHARVILESCHSSMSHLLVQTCGYGAAQKHARIFTRPVLQRLEENRHTEPLDVLRGTVHLLPRTLLADDKDTFRGLRNPIALEPVSKLVLCRLHGGCTCSTG